MTIFNPSAEAAVTPESSTPDSSRNRYQAQQLPALLSALQAKRVSGVLRLHATVNHRHRQTLLVLNQGHLIYGGFALPTTADIAALLKDQIGGEWLKMAISTSLEQGGSQITPHALLNRLVSMHLVSWENVAGLLLDQVAIAIEPFIAYPGHFSLKLEPQSVILSESSGLAGFSLEQVVRQLKQRQALWESLHLLLEGMETIPHLSSKAQQWLPRAESNPVEVAGIPLEKLLRWVDGQQSIVDFASTQGRDPLRVACELLPAFQAGWLVTDREATSAELQATILAVDDSELMRQLIQRVLGDRYRVLLAGTAIEALGILDKEPVEILLLDVTMPGIDGLELCRSIRGMSKFKNLPIVMVTAKDGFFDKVKGRMAGASEYLTKPFDSEQLQQLVGHYIQTHQDRSLP
jgi:CheY-like chemotaxis protein